MTVYPYIGRYRRQLRRQPYTHRLELPNNHEGFIEHHDLGWRLHVFNPNAKLVTFRRFDTFEEAERYATDVAIGIAEE